MSRKTIAVTVIIVMLLSILATPNMVFAEGLLSDNFENGTGNWSIVSGNWNTITDGSTVYHALSTDSLSRSVTGNSSWDNYTVEVKTKVNSWGNTTWRTNGIIGRFNDNTNYYLFVYETGELRIRKVVNGTQTTIASKAFTFNTNTWYTFKASLSGSDLAFFVNGVQQLSITDASLSSGKAGLVSVFGDSRFDDFHVQDFSIPIPTPTPTPTPVPDLLRDTFENGTSNWTTISGNWNTISDGSTVYHALSTDSLSRSVAGNSTWDNYTVEVKTKVNSWGNTTWRTNGIIGRFNDNTNYYLFVYESGELRIRKVVNGTQTTIASKAFTFNTNTWYTFKASLNGSDLAFYVNGVQQLSIADTSLSSGKAGLVSVFGDSRFDDFVVQNCTEPIPTPTPTPTPTPGEAFPFSQELVDSACAEGLLWFQRNLEWDWHSVRSGSSLYFLTIACSYDPNYSATDGTIIKDRVLAHIRNVITGGKEPGCSGGYNAIGYNSTINAFAVAKNIPAIWNSLTQTEKDKITLIMKAALVGSHWCFDDGNNFNTGIDQTGNFGKTWNPNYRIGGVGPGLAASFYLGGAAATNSFLTSFNYDTFVADLNAKGLSNIYWTFTQTPKATLEAAVKNAFTYNGYGLDQPFYWYKSLADFMYSKNVATTGADGLGYMLSGQAALLMCMKVGRMMLLTGAPLNSIMPGVQELIRMGLL